MLMGAHDGAVDKDVLEVCVIAQSLEKTLPNAVATPAVEALIDSVPAAKLTYGGHAS
jgi:hypothetical protein